MIELCAPCLHQPPDHDGAAAAVAYGDVARTIILRMKHGRRIALGQFVAAAMQRCVPDQGNWLLTPVPLHRWRIWTRGFNQSQIIARHLSAHSGHQLAGDLLLRTRHTPILGGLGRAERARALIGAFAVNPAQRDAIKGKRILIIDDVYTSGATSNACARVLKRAGAAEVRLICWARVIRDSA
jgi:ComF family protein